MTEDPADPVDCDSLEQEGRRERVTEAVEAVIRDRNAIYFAAGTTYDVAPDGERFLVVKRADNAQPYVVVVLNWFEELKQRVPTGDQR